MSNLASRIEVEDGDPPVPQPQRAEVKPEPSPETKPEPKPAPRQQDEDGTDWVDIDDPKLKARFNRLYRHTKEANAKAEKTERQVQLLAEQNLKLQSALDKLVGGMKDEAKKKELASLKQDMKEALATGDTESFVSINERLVDMKREVSEPKDTAPAAPPPIPETEAKVLYSWQNQAGEDGEDLRPWAKPGHPEFAATQDMIRRIVGEADMQDAPIREILQEVDKRMAKLLGRDDDDEEAPPPPRNTVQRAFSSPRGSRPAQRESVSLSAQERVIAEAMFMGGRGSLAKSSKEAHDLYLKQKKAMGRVVEAED
jgi:hypothetical protein